MEEQLSTVKRENEFLTLQIADSVRESQMLEDQMQPLSDIWAMTPPDSPTHLMPMPDELKPASPHVVAGVALAYHDKALRLHDVLGNMGYASRPRDIEYIMVMYQRAYSLKHGAGPLPKFYLTEVNGNKVKRYTMLSESDMPLLARVIKRHGTKRGPN
jgi:hypothetical protein